MTRLKKADTAECSTSATTLAFRTSNVKAAEVCIFETDVVMHCAWPILQFAIQTAQYRSMKLCKYQAFAIPKTLPFNEKLWWQRHKQFSRRCSYRQ